MTTSTKWRIYIWGNNGIDGDNLQVTEMQMRITVGGTDQCSGGTATADSSYDVGYTADKAFDNSNTTRWLPTAATGMQAHWLQYEFPSAVQIVEYSIDALSAANYPNSAPFRWWFEYFDGTNWIAVDFRENQSTWGSSETRVFTVDSATLGLLHDFTASASSDVGIGYQATQAFDFLSASFWAANVSTGWIEYAFSVPHAVNQYKIQCRNDNYPDSPPKTWVLEYYDGANWQTADSRTNEPSWSLGEWRTYTFSNSVAATRWRLNISEDEGNSHLALAEMHMFAIAGSPPVSLQQPKMVVVT